MPNRVFVINKHGQALMPCKPRKARVLLRTGKAKVIKKEPFTIQLLYGSTGYKQAVSLGVDSGQRHIGLAVTSQAKVLFQTEVELRQDVKSLLDTRRTYRRSRRNRKTRYRKARFLNRIASKKANWLPPSVASKVNHNINWVKRLLAVLPKPELHIEVGKFDMQKMKNPNIKGEGYQQGDLYGYQTVKQFVLARDNYTCQACKKKGGKLKIHHLIYRSLGGTNTVDNLITVCSECHTTKNHQTGILAKWCQDKKQVHKSYKGATFMNILRRRLFTAFPQAKFQYGAWTTLQRADLGLAKSHYNDAVAISGIKQIKVKPTRIVMFKQFRKKKRSLHEATARKGRKTTNVMSKRNAKNTKYAKGFWLNDYVKIKDSRSKGYISGFSKATCYIKDIFENYLTVSPKYKQVALSKLVRITHNNNWSRQEINEKNYQMY
ncbi:HNH endonuclease [Ligilactobacillus agilis]|nr:RNA-guided endonuclease IscB [Ligilactobacillus agilis]PLA83940.1 HNH endonuclease [Ligilactobacillus agilis]